MMITVQSLIQWLITFSELIEENSEYLTELDRQGGDGDHGVNMERGANVIHLLLSNKNNTFYTPAHLIETVSEAFLDGIEDLHVQGIGGAAGALYNSFMSGVARRSGGISTLDFYQFVTAFEGGVRELQEFSKAELNDKSMLDAAWCGSQVFSASLRGGDNFKTASAKASRAAKQACRDIRGLQARVGRFALIDSRGLLDPGAASMTLLFDALQAITE